MEIDKAVEGYTKHREILQKNFNNPDVISDELFKIGTYLTYMGDSLGDMKQTYEDFRAKSYMKYINRGEPATKAENLARVDTAGVRGQIQKLEIALKNGQNLISIGQSRLRVLESQNRNEA